MREPPYAVMAPLHDRRACIVEDSHLDSRTDETWCRSLCGQEACDPDSDCPWGPEDICPVCLDEARATWDEAEWPPEWTEATE